MANNIEIKINISGVGAEAVDLAREILAEDAHPAAAAAAGRKLAHAVLEAAEAEFARAEAQRQRAAKTLSYAYEDDVLSCRTCGKKENEIPEGEAQEDCQHDYGDRPEAAEPGPIAL